MENRHLVLDIGGSWIKGAGIDIHAYEAARVRGDRKKLLELVSYSRRTPSVSPHNTSFAQNLAEFVKECADEKQPGSIVISTAGIVDSSGSRVIKCASHLEFLRNTSWKEHLEDTFQCPVYLLNDAEAFTLGAAELDYVPRLGTVVSLVIGTGLGISIVKDGRWWRPHRTVPLMGSIRIEEGCYEIMASASRLTGSVPGKDLTLWLTLPEYATQRDRFWSNLTNVVTTAAILYGADKVLIGGGFCEAASRTETDISAEINSRASELPPELDKWPKVTIVTEGNAPQLLGAASLCAGPLRDKAHGPGEYDALATEQTHPGATNLHALSSHEAIKLLWEAEQEAGRDLGASLPQIAEVADHVIERWPQGGRIIYVGAGTSGRLAALDSVEIPCTFGVEPDRVVAVVAGGIEEAALNIENNGEEDFTSVPDLVLLDIRSHDTVIGISASGTAFFVQSALGFARRKGAATVLIQAARPTTPGVEWDWVISLHSGIEVVSGSTRMKAGTATKKVLNFLTTTVMIRCGKVLGPYMINVACLNKKLIVRSKRILRELFGVSEEEAGSLLQKHNFLLPEVIKQLVDSRSP